MKTKKLLLLVVGFMLFVLMANAQNQSYYNFTLKNSGIEIDYSITGNVHLYSPTSLYPINYGGKLSTGQTVSGHGQLYGLGAITVQISAMGYTMSSPLNVLERDGGFEYDYPEFKAILYLEKNGTTYDVEFKTQPK